MTKQTGLSWNRYLEAGASSASHARSRKMFEREFRRQREQIVRLIAEDNPKQIACLGSGYLNDLPVELLCNSDTESYLVDWIPGISEIAMRGRAIAVGASHPSCIFCGLESPEIYCARYKDAPGPHPGVCEAFCPISDPSLYCENYQPAKLPHFIRHDVTGGRATGFATQIEAVIERSTRPEEAYRRAIALCHGSTVKTARIPIDDDSIDLITSSMLVSQFDAEPYRYFALLLERKFGRANILARGADIRPLMERLRGELFRIQAEGHASEMYRILNKPKGLVYFSTELFRELPNNEGYFLVHEVFRGMQILSQYFTFDFSRLPPSDVLDRLKMGDANSVVQRYVLRPARGISVTR